MDVTKKNVWTQKIYIVQEKKSEVIHLHIGYVLEEGIEEGIGFVQRHL